MRRICLLIVLTGLLATLAHARDGLEIGDQAPAFELTDQHGETVRLADFEGRIVVLEWFCASCPAVAYHHDERRTMSDLAQRYAEHDVVWLAINSTHDEGVDDNAAIAEQWGMDYPILSDGSGETGHAYGARTTPHMFIIDADGKLAYRGAIDDDPGRRGNEEVNYVAQALDQLLAGDPVSEPDTFPYGCRVKYAR